MTWCWWESTGARVSDRLGFDLRLMSDGGGGFELFTCPWSRPEVDTCLRADVCDQVCILNGSLTCGCHQDYELSPTTGECKAKGESQIVTCQHTD